MDASCPSLPPKILVRNETDAELRPNAQTTVYMPAHNCHLVECFWYVLLVIIESFSSQCASQVSAQPSLYKTGPSILSRTFSKNNLRTRVRVGFDNFVDRIVAYILDSRIANNISDPNPAFAVLVELPSDVGVTTTWSWDHEVGSCGESSF